MNIQNILNSTQVAPVYPRISDEVPKVALGVFSAEDSQLSSADIEKVINDINKVFQQLKQNVQLQFSVDADTKKSVIKVVDAMTGDLIRQIPSEEILVMVRSIDQFQKSLLIEEKA
ncbi:MAG: flagellar protein FlaG [Methylococcaceae bacterium]|nr:flagellar protein FlaG [Methylococcaceae bacterium]